MMKVLNFLVFKILGCKICEYPLRFRDEELELSCHLIIILEFFFIGYGSVVRSGHLVLDSHTSGPES